MTQVPQEEIIKYSKSEFDEISLDDKPSISIKRRKSSKPTEFNCVFKGECLDFSIMNAIRRCIMTYVPVYGFNRSNITVNRRGTKCMYDDFKIMQQFETMPLFDIDNDHVLDDPESYLSNEVMKEVFGNYIQKKVHEIKSEKIDKVDETADTAVNKHTPKTNRVEVILDIENNTNESRYVTSHDLILKIDGKVQSSYKKRKEICMFALNPQQKMSVYARAGLGIPKIHASFECSDNAVYWMDEPGVHELIFNTLEQLSQDTIFVKSCEILIERLANLGKYIEKEYRGKKDVTEATIIINGCTHTTGNLLATTLQRCAKNVVIKAGYAVPFPHNDQMELDVVTNKVDVIKIILDAIKYLIRIYQKIISEFKKL